MNRQRVNLRTPIFGHLVAGLTIVLALLLLWYGLMVVLLAVKVSPHTVNSLSAYRTLYNDAADLTRRDFTTLSKMASTITSESFRVISTTRETSSINSALVI